MELVRAAKQAQVPQITLATNATRISNSGALKLKEAGVTQVVISVVTTQRETHRSLVSESTDPAHILRGISAFLEAGIHTIIRLPIARGLPSAAGRLLGLKHALSKLDVFRLAVIGAGETTLLPDQTLSTKELSEEITAAYDAGEKAKVTLTLDPEHPIAPCVVPLPPRARRLFSSVLRDENGPANKAHPACATCGLGSSCTFSKDQLLRLTGEGTADKPYPITPIADAEAFSKPGKSPGARLRVLGKYDVENFFLVHYDYGKEVAIPTSRLGIVYRCNQTCTFCELADMDTDVPPERVQKAIDEAHERGSIRLIVTGGEPTLSRHLVDHVRYAKERGFQLIELQTNAVLLDNRDFANRLADAGLTSAQISLHGPDASISDRLTAAPGTHARTLKGITNLLNAGVTCLLNHLIFRDNCHLLLDFVEMANQLWGDRRAQLVIQFHSPRNEFTSRDNAMRHIAKYTDYAPLLRKAIERARAYQIATHDLQDPTGIPALCVLGADETYLGRIAAQTEQPRFHEWERSWLTHVEKCESCDLKHACMGIPKPYLALFGDAEFVPFKNKPPSQLPGEPCSESR